MDPIAGEFPNDVFISYNGVSRAFAQALESRIENYTAPRQLGAAQRRLRAFRYEGDMTGTDYYAAIEKHLGLSRCLIVLCTPEARQSVYVNDEIRRFVEKPGPKRSVIPVLLAGVPNNVAKSEAEKAFPESLYLATQMPLAIDYRGVEARRGKLNRAPFESQWYTLLANLFDVSRDEIEQRDRARRLRRFKFLSAVSCIVAALLLGLATVARIQRAAAVSAGYESESRLATLAADTAAGDGESVRALLLAKYALELKQLASPGERAPRAETLMHQLGHGLPGVGLAGWQEPTPRQTAIVAWSADEPSGRWLVTGNFGTTEARLWDLEDPRPGTTGRLLPPISIEAAREGRLVPESSDDVNRESLPNLDWTLHRGPFAEEPDPLPPDDDAQVLAADGDWRLVQGDGGDIRLEQLPEDAAVPAVSLTVARDASDYFDVEAYAGSLRLLPGEEWLLMLGYRGHRLLHLPSIAADRGRAGAITAARWLGDTGVLAVGTAVGEIRISTDNGRSWSGLQSDHGFIRDLAVSADGAWLLAQHAPGNWTIWRREEGTYTLVRDEAAGILGDKSDRLEEALRAASQVAFPRLLGLVDDTYSPRQVVTADMTVTPAGELTIQAQSGATRWRLPEGSAMDSPSAALEQDAGIPQYLAYLVDGESGISPDGRWAVSAAGLQPTGVGDAAVTPGADEDVAPASIWSWPDIGGGSFPSVALFSADSEWLLLLYGYRGFLECGYFATARLIHLGQSRPLDNVLNLDPDPRWRDLTRCFPAEFGANGQWLAFGSLLVPLDDPEPRPIELDGNIVAVDPNGESVILESPGVEQPTWRMQSLRIEALAAEACEKAGRNLSGEEWAALYPGRSYRAICPDYPVPPR